MVNKLAHDWIFLKTKDYLIYLQKLFSYEIFSPEDTKKRTIAHSPASFTRVLNLLLITYNVSNMPNSYYTVLD